MKKYFLIILLFLLIFNINLISKNLNFNEVKVFKIVDWNMDGRFDLLVQLKNDDVGVYLNQADGNNYVFNEFINFAVEKGRNPIETAAQLKKNKITGDSDKKSSYKSFDVMILNFINGTQGIDSFDLQWLKTGIPDLLMYEVKLPKNVKVMNREDSRNYNLQSALKKSEYVVNGVYKIENESLHIDLNITSMKGIKKISVKGNKSNNGILILVSKLGQLLNKELNKMYSEQ